MENIYLVVDLFKLKRMTQVSEKFVGMGNWPRSPLFGFFQNGAEKEFELARQLFGWHPPEMPSSRFKHGFDDCPRTFFRALDHKLGDDSVDCRHRRGNPGRLFN